MADISYIINDPTTPNLIIPTNLGNPPATPAFKIDGYRGATPSMYTPEHQAACCHVTLTNAINVANKFLSTPLTKWAATNMLYVQPRAGLQFNAFYDRQALRFFYANDPITKKLVYSVNSTDVVAHELGHAILDAVRPDLFNVQAMEIWAFHESFGDIHAIINILQHQEVLDYMLAETGGNLKQSNVATRLAEEMGTAIYNMTAGRMGHTSGSLRNAFNTFKYVTPETLPKNSMDNQLASECHNFSRVFTGAWYDILVAIYELEKVALPPKEALISARDICSKYIFQALPFAPATIRFYDAMARAMLLIDKANNYKYNEVMNSVFIARNILKSVVRPMVDMTWEMFQSVIDAQDEVMDNMAVRNKKIDLLSLPVHMMNVEVPSDTYYEFEEGICTNIITNSSLEVIAHAEQCVEYLQEHDMIRPDKQAQFELDVDGNLIRSHFACGCATGCAGNAGIKGQPEYGKGKKPKNNKGCGGACPTATPTKPVKTTSVAKTSCCKQPIGISAARNVVKSTTGCGSVSLGVGSSGTKISSGRNVRLSVTGGCTSGGDCCTPACPTETLSNGTCIVRQKIVLGDYGQDGGDVSDNNPMPVTIIGPDPLPVTYVAPEDIGEPLAIFGDTTLVSAMIETTVATYTVPTDKTFETIGFMASANLDAQFFMYINGVQITSSRSSVAELNVDVRFLINLEAEAGQTVTVKMIHYNSGVQGNAESTILGRLRS